MTMILKKLPKRIKITTTSEEQQASSNEQSDKKIQKKRSLNNENVLLSPLARNMAEDKDLDITRIKGTVEMIVLQN